MDKDEKKWLDDVRPIILADEEKTYRELKDKADRDEFQKIFWARRDPNLDTPANEFQDAYLRRRGREVDTQFKVGSDARLGHRLRARVHPARQAGRDEGGAGRGDAVLRTAGDLDLSRSSRADLRRRRGEDRLREELRSCRRASASASR